MHLYSHWTKTVSNASADRGVFSKCQDNHSFVWSLSLCSLLRTFPWTKLDLELDNISKHRVRETGPRLDPGPTKASLFGPIHRVKAMLIHLSAVLMSYIQIHNLLPGPGTKPRNIPQLPFIMSITLQQEGEHWCKSAFVVTRPRHGAMS